MKKSAKIITATLAAITVLFAAMAITVSADTETNSDIIISQNVAYTGDFALMYAVDPAKVTAPVTLNIYEAEPTEASTAKYTFTSSATTPAATSGLDIDAYIFIANGTAAKDMTKVYYAQVVDANGVKSEVKRYSVAEYLYERLATPGITEKQEALYESVITFGDKAIDLLAAGNPLVSDYKYVTIEGGTLDGTYDAGIYLKNDTVNPQAEGVTSWTASDGTKVANGESYTIGDSHVSFAETVDTEEPAVDTITIDRTKTGTNTFETYTINTQPSKFGYDPNIKNGDTGIRSDIVNGTASQIMYCDPAGNGTLSLYKDSSIVSDVTEDEATAFEISADMKFVPDSTTLTYQNLVFRALTTEANAQANAFVIKVFMNNGDLYFTNTADGADENENYTLAGGASQYNHICFRFTGEGGAVQAKLYINGTYACTFTTQNSGIAGNTYVDFKKMFCLRVTFDKNSTDSKVYVDNLFQGLVK